VSCLKKNTFLGKEIKTYYLNRKSKNVKRSAIRGKSGLLWKAVKILKDISIECISGTLSENRIEIQPEQTAERFASFINMKINNVLRTTNVDENVYNGTRHVHSKGKFFGNISSVKNDYLH
jgi:hypothetical protein